MRQHPGSNNCVEGAYGIARFDRREPVESDEHARSTCGVRELRQPLVRRSVRQRAAAARRPTSIVCWWRRLLVANGRCWRGRGFGAAPAPACAGDDGPARQRATNTTLAATRRHPRGSVSDQHDTRRHTATSARQRARPTRHSPPHGDIDADDICCCGRRPRRAVQLRGARQSMVLKNQRFRARVNPLAPNLRARAREGAALAARARGWCATAPRFKQLR